MSEDPTRDLASSLLDKARGTTSSRTTPAPPRRGSVRADGPVYSGPGPDERDPVRVDRAVSELVSTQDWEQRTKVAGAIANWDRVAGPDIAAHVAAESFVNSVLTLRADSTAWATQVRLLMPMVRRRVDAELGEGVVADIVVKGPDAPRHKGAWRVKGRGHRDTYG